MTYRCGADLWGRDLLHSTDRSRTSELSWALPSDSSLRRSAEPNKWPGWSHWGLLCQTDARYSGCYREGNKAEGAEWDLSSRAAAWHHLDSYISTLHPEKNKVLAEFGCHWRFDGSSASLIFTLECSLKVFTFTLKIFKLFCGSSNKCFNATNIRCLLL